MEVPHGLRGTDNSGNHQTENAPGQEDTYEPWMVVARRKSEGKLVKGMDPTKNLANSKSQAQLNHHGFPDTKMDQNRGGKRKVSVGQVLLGQATRDNLFKAPTEASKPAFSGPRQPTDCGVDSQSPLTSNYCNPSPLIFD